MWGSSVFPYSIHNPFSPPPQCLFLSHHCLSFMVEDFKLNSFSSFFNLSLSLSLSLSLYLYIYSFWISLKSNLGRAANGGPGPIQIIHIHIFLILRKKKAMGVAINNCRYRWRWGAPSMQWWQMTTQWIFHNGKHKLFCDEKVSVRYRGPQKRIEMKGGVTQAYDRTLGLHSYKFQQTKPDNGVSIPLAMCIAFPNLFHFLSATTNPIHHH